MRITSLLPFRWLSIIPIVALISIASPSSAETIERHYISDILLVPLRTGPTIQHRIINAGLRSGTEVVLLESDPDSQWSRIRFGEQEGWVPTRHIIDQPIARDQLAALEAELARLQEDYSQLQRQWADSEQGISTVSNDMSSLQAERDAALLELERVSQLAGSEVMLDRRNEELLAENRTLQAENEQLLAMKASLERDTEQWRMIIGGGLVLGGIIVGLIFPSIARRRRSDGWN